LYAINGIMFSVMYALAVWKYGMGVLISVKQRPQLTGTLAGNSDDGSDAASVCFVSFAELEWVTVVMCLLCHEHWCKVPRDVYCPDEVPQGILFVSLPKVPGATMRRAKISPSRGLPAGLNTENPHVLEWRDRYGLVLLASHPQAQQPSGVPRQSGVKREFSARDPVWEWQCRYGTNRIARNPFKSVVKREKGDGPALSVAEDPMDWSPAPPPGWC
jgi:hypothetical protein